MPESNRGEDNRGAGFIGDFDPDFKHGQEVHGDIRTNLPSNEDAFGNILARGTTNELDVGSQYDFNPERMRYVENGTRILDPDADSTRFTDTQNTWQIIPEAGDTCDLFTAQRSAYVVGFDGQASLAANIDGTLGTGDVYEFGVSDRQDPINKAYFEYTPDGQRAVIVNAGTEVASESFELPTGVTQETPIRAQIDFNCYGIGRYKFSLTYTDSSEPIEYRQKEETVAELTVDDDYSTSDFNYHIYHCIDAATAGPTYNLGSFAYLTQGKVVPSSRTKSARYTPGGNNYSGTGDYEPLLAVRLDANRGNVYTTFQRTEAVPSTGDGELLTIVVPETQTDATGFATPPQHNELNSVIEFTDNVTTFPDVNGNLVTSAANPGGYQIGFFSTDAIGGGTSAARSTESFSNPRPLYEDDVAILLYKADLNQAREVNVVYSTQQFF